MEKNDPVEDKDDEQNYKYRPENQSRANYNHTLPPTPNFNVYNPVPSSFPNTSPYWSPYPPQFNYPTQYPPGLPSHRQLYNVPQYPISPQHSMGPQYPGSPQPQGSLAMIQQLQQILPINEMMPPPRNFGPQQQLQGPENNTPRSQDPQVAAMIAMFSNLNEAQRQQVLQQVPSLLPSVQRPEVTVPEPKFTTEEFENLLQHGEMCFLDYKEYFPAPERWESVQNWSDGLTHWIRSAVSIYNSPHRVCRPGYIICGVKEHTVPNAGVNFELIGCNQSAKPDENVLRIFSSKFFENADSSLSFTLHVLTYALPQPSPFKHIFQKGSEPKLFYIIEIPAIPMEARHQRRAIFPKQDIGGKLKKDTIYYRHKEYGSTARSIHVKDNSQESKEFWKNFTLDKTEAAGIHGFILCAGLDKSPALQSLYVITSSISEANQHKVAGLINLPIDGIIDLDHNSQYDGLLKHALYINKHITIHHTADTDNWDPSTEIMPWIFPSKEIHDINLFIQQHEKNFSEKFVEKLAERKKTVKLLVIWDTDSPLQLEILKRILSLFVANFADHQLAQVAAVASLHCKSLLESHLKSATSHNPPYVQSFDLPAEFIQTMHYFLQPKAQNNEFLFKDGDSPLGRKALPDPQLLQVKKYLRVVNHCLDASDYEPEKFYRGARKISWKEVDEHCYVKRAVGDAITKDLELHFASAKEITPFYFYYRPGAGGTTLVRSVMWHFIKSANVAEVITGSFDRFETAKAIHVLQPAESSVGVLIVLKDVDDIKLDALHAELKSKKIKGAILVVRRTQVLPKFVARSPQYILDDIFHNALEATQFYDFFVHKLLPKNKQNFVEHYGPSPKKCEAQFIQEKKLEKVRQPRYKSALITFSPFYMALYAFEKDFQGVETYVRDKLEQLKDSTDIAIKLRTLFNLMAIGDFFLNCGTDVAKAAKAVELIRQGSFDINSCVSYPCLDLLQESESGYWKIRHITFAEQILELMKNKREVARLVMAYTTSVYVPDKSVIAEVVVPYFLKKSEQTASKFPAVINYVMDDNDSNGMDSAMYIYTELTKYYAQETHVQGHYGRYLSLAKQLHNEGRAQIRKCLEIHGHSTYAKSHLLTMLGGTHRAQIKTDREKVPLNALLAEHFEQAAENFKKARSTYAFNPHSYLSFVDMVLEISNIPECQPWKAAMKDMNLSDTIICSALEDADCILEGYKDIFAAGEESSKAWEKYSVRKTRLASMMEQAAQLVDQYRSNFKEEKNYIINRYMFVHFSLNLSQSSFSAMLKNLRFECYKALSQAKKHKSFQKLSKDELYDSFMRYWFRLVRFHGTEEDREEIRALLSQWVHNRADYSPWPNFYYNLLQYGSSVHNINDYQVQLYEVNGQFRVEEWLLNGSKSGLWQFVNKNDINKVQNGLRPVWHHNNYFPVWKTCENTWNKPPAFLKLEFIDGAWLKDKDRQNAYRVIPVPNEFIPENSGILTKDELDGRKVKHHAACAIIGLSLDGLAATYVALKIPK